MTLRELLTETAFDPMVPFIRKSERADDVCYFKLAYDILLHTSPNEEGYEYVAVSIDKSPEGKIYYNAPQLEGCLWSNYIDGEVILKGNVDVCQADLAYQLLNQLTFYGYGDKYSANLFGDEHYNNKYSWMAREVEHKRDMAWATNAVRRRVRASMKENKAKGLNPFEISVEDYYYVIYKRKLSARCNRMKRKREYRWGKRLEKLNELERRENPIYELLRDQISFVTRKDLLFLWDANERLVRDFQTKAYDVKIRLAYLNELITKYDALKLLKQVKKCVVKIATSSNYPLSQEEINCIRAMISPWIADGNPLVMQGVDESLGCELGIFIIGVENLPE